MRKTTLIATVFATLLGGAAFAQTNPGMAQLAGIAGVSPDGFSQAQLIQLIEAQRNGDADTVDFILSQRGVDVGRADAGTTFGGNVGNDGKAQLAAQVGVNADDYTMAQLIALTSPVTDRD